VARSVVGAGNACERTECAKMQGTYTNTQYCNLPSITRSLIVVVAYVGVGGYSIVSLKGLAET